MKKAFYLGSSLFGLVALQVSFAHAAPSFSGIAKNADGSVHHTSQYDAEIYCRDQGHSLPTARELAIYAQSKGAQGISETPKPGYNLVKGTNTATGKSDSFYYSSEGYRSPTDNFGKQYGLWSSTVNPDYQDSEDYSHAGFTLNIDDGHFVTDDRRYDGYTSAVLCVQ